MDEELTGCGAGHPPCYRFGHLSRYPELAHAVFTRQGGESRGAFASLNMARSVGDDPEAVRRNRERIRAAMGGGALRFARQAHGDGVAVFDGDPSPTDPPEPPVADAMITDRPGLNLVIQVADCQAALLYDPVKRVAGNIHSGWRSSIANIIGKTVDRMWRRFGSSPSDILAGIGPSLGPCCAEFVHYRKEIPEQYWEFKDERDHFDFWAISRRQLLEAGVNEAHIETCGICTRCRKDLFFSYRGEGVTGRFAAVIGLR